MADAPVLTPAGSPSRGWGSLLRLAAKTVLLVLVLNLAGVPLNPVATLGRWSVYNSVFPGRLRFPYADDSARSYSVSVMDLEALFHSHDVAGPGRKAGELRVLVIGDSSVWGFRLGPRETLAAHLDRLGLESNGRPLSFYNLGYPTMSLAKDLLLLEGSLEYRPDLIVWLVTLESFPSEVQSASPLVSVNRGMTATVLRGAGIDPSRYLPPGAGTRWWADTIVGRRRDLADWFRLQLFGVMWAASGIDYDAEATYPPRADDLDLDPHFHGYGPGEVDESDLAWDVLGAGIRAAGPTPVLIVNEPMFVSRGANSDARYNSFYPRWVYDAYRMWLRARCQASSWTCLDLWDALPADVFTDSAVHYNPAGAETLARRLADSMTAEAAGLDPAP